MFQKAEVCILCLETQRGFRPYNLVPFWNEEVLLVNHCHEMNIGILVMFKKEMSFHFLCVLSSGNRLSIGVLNRISPFEREWQHCSVDWSSKWALSRYMLSVSALWIIGLFYKQNIDVAVVFLMKKMKFIQFDISGILFIPGCISIWKAL